MNIEKIFSTKERVKILNNILYLEGEFGVNEIAKKLKISKGLVSKLFEILMKEGILKRNGQKFIVKNNSLTKSLKIMLNIQKIDVKVFKKHGFVKSVGMYGSCVKGTNTEISDIDLWIKINKTDDEKIAKLTSELRKKIENAKILILDNEKINLLKKKDIPFYYSLYFGSVILYGEENEI